MIEIIVFSENNPQMLFLTLESLQKNAPKNKINIIYQVNDNLFEGYEICEAHYPKMNFINSKIDYKQDLKSLLKTFNKANQVLLMTDRDILFEPFDESIIQSMMNNNDILAFSLRLGKNVTHCARMDSDNILKAEDVKDGMKWDWTKHYLDFGYPFSLQGHIFNIKEFNRFVKNTQFENRNSLEEGLQMFENYPKTFMAAFNKSKIVYLTNGSDYISYAEFLDGYEPQLESMDFNKLDRCESEIYFENLKRTR